MPAAREIFGHVESLPPAGAVELPTLAGVQPSAPGGTREPLAEEPFWPWWNPRGKPMNTGFCYYLLRVSGTARQIAVTGSDGQAAACPGEDALSEQIAEPLSHSQR